MNFLNKFFNLIKGLPGLRRAEGHAGSHSAVDPVSESNLSMNETVQKFLDAYAQGGEVEGGWLYAAELRQAQLDFSDESFERLETLMVDVKAHLQSSSAAVLETPQGQNFLDLIGYYIGEYVRRKTGADIQWYDLIGARLAMPDVKIPDASWSRRICFAPDQGASFAPLVWIEGRLFGSEESSATENCEYFIRLVNHSGPGIWGTAMNALGRTASWQMMFAAEGSNLPALFLSSHEPTSWHQLMPTEDVLDEVAKRLEENPKGAAWQIFSYDGIIEDGTGRNAITVCVCTYGEFPLQVKLAFPYTPAKGHRPFRILTPACLGANLEYKDMMALGGAVERGIQSVKWVFGKTWSQLQA